MQRVVLIGDGQIHTLCELYRRFAAKSFNEIVTFIRSRPQLPDAAIDAITAADIIVEQVDDAHATAREAGPAPHAGRILVPRVNCDFLWPFAGPPHPHNPIRPFLEGGPYGADLSDGYLNGLVLHGVDPDLAARRYLDADIDTLVDLDRLYESNLETLRRHDRITGFSIADLVAARFRDEQIFLSPNRPNTRIAKTLASRLFEMLEVAEHDITRMTRAIRFTPLERNELPVHPAVARHFKLNWAADDRRYRFLSEGSFTFREFATRYMTCHWNEALEEGLHLAHGRDSTTARSQLEAALAASPGSSPGHGALGHVLEASGEIDAAIEEYRRAITLDPNDARHHACLAELLGRRGDVWGAERELRVAAALEPSDPQYYALLANFLNQQQRHAEAIAVGWHGFAHAPYALDLHVAIGHAHARLGNVAEAERAYRRAAALPPASIAPLVGLADVLEECGRSSVALTVIEDALRIEPTNEQLRHRRKQMLGAAGPPNAPPPARENSTGSSPVDRAGYRVAIAALRDAEDIGAAVRMARRAVARFASDMELRQLLASALQDAGQLDEAVGELRHAVSISPHNEILLLQLGDVLVGLAQLTEAEEAYRDAIRIAPANPQLHSRLGHVLGLRGKHDDAVAADASYRKALVLAAKAGTEHANISGPLTPRMNYRDDTAAASGHRSGRESVGSRSPNHKEE